MLFIYIFSQIFGSGKKWRGWFNVQDQNGQTYHLCNANVLARSTSTVYTIHGPTPILARNKRLHVHFSFMVFIFSPN